MKMKHVLRVVAAGLAAWLCAAPARSAGWTLTDLGTLGGTDSEASGLNNAGQVVGYAEGADGTPYPVIWSNGVPMLLSTRPGRAVALSAGGIAAGNVTSATSTRIDATLLSGGNAYDLGTFGGSFSIVAAVNDSGQVGGYARTSDEKDHAFLGTASGMVDLGTFGGTSSYVYGLNQAGLAVGTAFDASGSQRCFRSTGGGLIDLGTLGGRFCNAFAVNDAGQITGNSATSAGIGHAFVSDSRGMVDLGTLGGSSSIGYAINRLGQVAGSARTASNQSHAFFHDGTRMIDLGTLGGTTSTARRVNASGQVVGSSTLANSSTSQAFFYSNGVMSNINTLVPGLSNVDAGNIYLNDAGQIAGTGTIGGNKRAFLLTPTP
jgi:probable HAF family extracellular repeat protein